MYATLLWTSLQNMYTTSGLSILIHHVISLPDATSCDNLENCTLLNDISAPVMALTFKIKTFKSVSLARNILQDEEGCVARDQFNLPKDIKSTRMCAVCTAKK